MQFWKYTSFGKYTISRSVTMESGDGGGVGGGWSHHGCFASTLPFTVNVVLLIRILAVSALLLATVLGSETHLSTPSLSASRIKDPREFCESEVFNPICDTDEVIVVTEAKYGRMEIGRCVQTDYGYVGCMADVIEHLDYNCSGKRNCSIRIPDKSLDAANKCPKEFKTYLNVSHKCVPVEENACDQCNGMRSKVAKITSSKAYIGSIVTQEAKSSVPCGSQLCPWQIEVQSGQTINITFYDFGTEQLPKSSTGLCLRYAVIKEATNPRETPVCAGGGRHQEVYSSVSNVVEIVVVSPQVIKNKAQFLFYYEAVGCPDYQTPVGAWIQRHGDRITVGCNQTDQRWDVICVDMTWIGEIGTCPDFTYLTPAPPVPLPLGVLVAIVLGIAMVIGVLIVTVGIVCIKRQQNNLLLMPVPDTHIYMPAEQYEMQRQHGMMCQSTSSCSGRRKQYGRQDVRPHQHKQFLVAGGRNVYGRTHMKSRPLPSLPNLSEASYSAGDMCCSQCSAPGPSTGGNQRGNFQRESSYSCSTDPCPYHQQTLQIRTSSPVVQVHAAPKGLGGSAGGGSGKRTPPKRSKHLSGSTGGGKSKAPPNRSNSAAASCSSTGGAAAAAAASVASSCAAPPPPRSHIPQPPQHYTVLDPIEVQHLIATSSAAAAAAAAAQAAAAAAAAANRQSTDDGSPVNGSCQEMTLRPSREGSQPNILNPSSSNSGNSSWP